MEHWLEDSLCIFLVHYHVHLFRLFLFTQLSFSSIQVPIYTITIQKVLLVIDAYHILHRHLINSRLQSFFLHLTLGLIQMVGITVWLFYRLEFVIYLIERLKQMQLSMSHVHHDHTYEPFLHFLICKEGHDWLMSYLMHPYLLEKQCICDFPMDLLFPSDQQKELLAKVVSFGTIQLRVT
jgi:hypothetical protein